MLFRSGRFFLSVGDVFGDGRGQHSSSWRRPHPRVVSTFVGAFPDAVEPEEEDTDSGAGASALANRPQLPVPPDSGLSLRSSQSESEAGSKEERGGSLAATPSTGWHIPQDKPPAETPAPARLTGILHSPSDSRYRPSGQVFAAFPPWVARAVSLADLLW